MQIDKELMKGSTVTLVLKLLEEQSMYGYEIIKEMEKASQGIFQFKEGTLYPVLHSLESQGMVEAYWSEDSGPRKRKYYRLTKRGTELLRARQEEWRVFSKAVNAILGEVHS